MERIVGIDLGTTNSLIAFMDGEAPRVITDPQTGNSLLPSIVSYFDDGRIVVGDEAKALLVEHPLTTIHLQGVWPNNKTRIEME